MDDTVVTRDSLISELRQLRQRVAELEARDAARETLIRHLQYEAHIMSAMPQAITATDLSGTIVYWNHSAETLYGWRADEAIGRSILDVTVDATAALAIMERLRAGELWSGDFAVKRRDGRQLPIYLSTSPILDNEGQIIGMVGLSIDITQRQELEARLREQTETITTINTVGQRVSAELDLQKLVQIVTDAATGLSGAQFGAFFYNQEDELGERYTLYTISGAPREAFAQFPMPRNTAVFGPTFRGEGVIRLGNVCTDPRYGQSAPYHGMPAGHLPVTSYLAVPVISRSGKVWGGLFFGHEDEDVFDERAEQLVTGLAAQAAVAMDNAQLYQDAQRAIQVRDEFLSLAAHELKTPMTAMLGYMQLLQRRLERDQLDTDRLKQTVTTLVEQAGRLENLINTLFDLSRMRAGQLAIEPRLLDLVALVTHTVEVLQPVLEQHRVDFRSIGEGPTLVMADPQRIEQVVTNLLQNALKYSPDGGQIEVCVERRTNVVCLSIRDHGIGIPASALPQLFTRFYRASNAHQGYITGLGIGLYIVKQIVTRHGGTVDVESDEGKGTTFRVCLPLYEPGSDAARDSKTVLSTGGV